MLVVDDDRATCEALSTALEAGGATVACAQSAAEALREIERHVPDVLVSDLRMPGGSGLDLIAAIRGLATHRGGDIRAIALSGWTDPEDRQLAGRLGFQRFLTKPVELDDLVGAIRTVLELPPDEREGAAAPGPHPAPFRSKPPLRR